jgi:hypothetical protein
MARPRIPKGAAREADDLDAHLYLLRQHLHHLSEDVAHLKAIAAELRVLVCKSSGTAGLLWRLAERYGVADQVHVHFPGNVNPDHALARGLKFAVAAITRPTPHLERKLLSRLYSLREIIENGEAMWVLGMKSYTHERLILTVSQQTGSSHEDEGIEIGLAAAEDVLINGVPLYLQILRTDAELVLEVGERVLAAARVAGDHPRRRFGEPVTLVVHLRVREVPLGREKIASFGSYIVGGTFDAYLGPTEFSWTVTNGTGASSIVGSRLSATWQPGDDMAFALVYRDGESAIIEALSAGASGDHASLDLGNIETDVTVRWVADQRPHFDKRAILVYRRALTAAEVGQIPEFTETARRPSE